MQQQRLPRRIYIPLTEEMAQALYAIAVHEKRVTTDQAAILLRDRLIQLGYLGADKVLAQPAPQS